MGIKVFRLPIYAKSFFWPLAWHLPEFASVQRDPRPFDSAN